VFYDTYVDFLTWNVILTLVQGCQKDATKVKLEGYPILYEII